MIFGGVEFDYYQESDAAQVAELLNRNRFHTARNARMTAENFMFTQRGRGTIFLIVAKKNGKIVGMAGAYPSSDNYVARKNQAILGSFLVDMKYRLSYSMITGLYRAVMDGLVERGYKEVLGAVRPENSGMYHLMIKCGFVILDERPNDFGRIYLHNLSPVFADYAGAACTEVNSSTLYSSMPVVDKKEARKLKSKARINDRYIECDYKLNDKDVIILFDIVNYKIDGAIVPNCVKIYPDFNVQGRYVAENLSKTDEIDFSVKLVMEPGSGIADKNYGFSLRPGQSQSVECSKDVSEFRFLYQGVWYRLYPNSFEEVITAKEPISLDNGKLSAKLQPSSGFITVMNGEIKLATLLWPCAAMPYIEGLFAPRMKELDVEQAENCLVITEETDTYKLTRKCLLLENKMEVTTTLKRKTKDFDARPISQIYAEKGVQGYTVKSGDNEKVFGAAKIKHQGYEFSDYTYWDTEPEWFAGFPPESISLKYPTSTVDFIIDKNSKPIDHAPIFTFTLDFDKEKLLDEQVIEKIEVYFRTEEV